MSDEQRRDEEPEVEGHRFPPTVGASDDPSDEVEAHGRRG